MMKKISLLAAAIFAGQLHAGVIPNVSVQSVYSEFSSDNRRATSTANGMGLFGDIHTVTAGGSMWLTSQATPPSGDFTNAFVVFDLGSVRTLDRMKVWNYNEAGNLTQRGIQRADILTAGEDLVFTTNFSNVFFERAPGAFTNFAQTINLNGIQARFVRFNVKTNHYVSGAAENRVGLSEVQFFDTNVPPRLDFASRNYSSNKVTVLFSESVNLSTATNLANYSITTDGTNSASILSAAMEFYNNRIVLETTTLSNLNYTLHVSNVASATDGTTITNDSQVSIEPELALWLKADAGVTADGSGLVSQWADQSGNGNNADQIDPTFQPVLTAGALNGQPVVHFNGGVGFTNYMLVPHAPSLALHSGDISIFAVMNFQTFNSFNTIICKIQTNTQPAAFDGYVRGTGAATTGQVTFLRGNGWGNTTLNGSSNIVTGQPYVLSFVVRGTNGIEYINGAFTGTASIVAGVGDVGSPVAIGGRTPAVNNFGTRLNGDMAEVMVIRGAVTDTERTAIHNYLGTKYGIPIVNLVFNEQPQSQTKLEGQTAKFKVNVTANSPNVAYQWQRSGTNIPNATNATYTTPILTLADNNSTYRVQVSVTGSSQFSDTATLTVQQDLQKPTVISAGRTIWNPSQILVVFSERIDATSGLNAANYILDNGAAVTGVSYGETSDKILLTASGLTSGTSYMLLVQNVRDLFTNTMDAAQTAVGIYPAAALWLKADAGVTADGSGFVSQWNDQSGNGNNAMPFGGPETFPLLTNGFNNQPVLHFGLNGTNLVTNYLACSSSPSLALTSDMSIYAVASFIDFSAFRTIVSKTSLNQPAPFDFYMQSGTGAPRFIRGNGTLSTILTAATGASAGVPHLLYVASQENSVSHYLDGKTNGTGTVTAPLGDNGDNLFIGHRYSDAGTTMKGDIAEIILFGSALSDGDRTAMDKYFAAKYNLTLGTIPNLSFVANSGNTIGLSWPVPTATFVLETAENLSGATWTAVTNTITSTNGTNSVTINVSGSQQFYRLHKP